MKYTLSSSSVYQKAQNTVFRDASFETVDELKGIVQKDWMPASLSGPRKNENFVFSMFLFGDVDNEDEDNFCSIAEFANRFSGQEYYLITSRNHGKPKTKGDGSVRAPADRFHVLFPLEEPVWDGELLDSMINDLVRENPFFDASAKGRCRFYYGFDGAQIIYNPGKKWPVRAQEIEVPDVAVGAPTERLIFTEESALKLILEALPAARDAGAFKGYHDWVSAGQALKHLGCDFEIFASITDPGVKNARAKWDSFTATKYGKGTLVHYARIGQPELFKPGSARKVLTEATLSSRETIKPKSMPDAKVVGEGQERRERPVANLLDRSQAVDKGFGAGKDRGEPAPMSIFPHVKVDAKGGVVLRPTIENFEALLHYYGITCQENLMTHRTETVVAGVFQDGKKENAALGEIISVANLNSLPHDLTDKYLISIAHKKAYHPVEKWLDELPAWDGSDWIGKTLDLLNIREDFDHGMARAFFERWLISGVAAIYERSYRGRGVLTLQGPQSIGKTTFFKYLVPEVVNGSKFFQEGLSIDAGNKDTLEIAISHWISELGELEGIFKRSEIAPLKAFLTKEVDDIRLPYERRAETYPRRSIFCATVNRERFLADETGNTRFWTIPMTGFKKLLTRGDFCLEGIWSQAVSLYRSGKQWWLTPEEEAYLDGTNKDHEELDEVMDAILTHYDIDSLKYPETLVRVITCTEIAREIGYGNANKMSVNKISSSCIKLGIQKGTRAGGHRGFRMPDPLTDFQRKARANRFAAPERRDDPI